jgi:predicted amidophosphoribosyltransferase
VNGPNPICAGCGEIMKVWGKPICDKCLSASGVEPAEFCALCEGGLKADKFGLHLTKAGGYAGKCTANGNTSSEQSSEKT